MSQILSSMTEKWIRGGGGRREGSIQTAKRSPASSSSDGRRRVGVHLGNTCANVLRIHALILLHASSSQRILESLNIDVTRSGAALKNRERGAALSLSLLSPFFVIVVVVHPIRCLKIPVCSQLYGPRTLSTAPHRSGQRARAARGNGGTGGGRFSQVQTLLFTSGAQVILGPPSAPEIFSNNFHFAEFHSFETVIFRGSDRPPRKQVDFLA